MSKALKVAAFDLDSTLIEKDTDAYLNEIAHITFPSNIDQLYFEQNWPIRMNAAFEFMRDRYGIDTHQILEVIAQIKIEPLMIELIKRLKENGFSLLLLSDANSLFAEEILMRNGILKCFDKIFTNPAKVSENGLIKVKPFYEVYNKDEKPFKCNRCLRECSEPSICKGQVLADYLNSMRPKQVIYFGDGSNDLCPGLILTETDYFFVRKDMRLAEMLQEPVNLERIKSKVRYWRNAEEILQKIEF